MNLCLDFVEAFFYQAEIMKRRLYPSIVSLVAALAIASVISAHDIDVYIITGQSNSLGTTGLEGGAPNYEPGTDSSDGSTNLFWSNVSAANTGFPPVLYGDSGGSITTLQIQQGDSGANPRFLGARIRIVAYAC